MTGLPSTALSRLAQRASCCSVSGLDSRFSRCSRFALSSHAELYSERPYSTHVSVQRPQKDAGAPPVHSLLSAMPWKEYFETRTRRNRVRPLFGVPGALLSVYGVIRLVPFNPFEPIMSVDPAFVAGFGAIVSAGVGYQMGGAAGQVIWRLWNRDSAAKMDVMDRIFYAKVKTYRAERGQSPYVQTPGRALSAIASSSPSSANPLSPVRQDFYGEKVKSVQDYRSWLRRQRKWNKEHIGSELQPIRGVPVKD